METAVQTLRREAGIVLACWNGSHSRHAQWAYHFEREARLIGERDLANAASQYARDRTEPSHLLELRNALERFTSA